MNNLTTTYSTFLRAGGRFRDAVLAALGARKYLPEAEVAALAAVHAKHYKCEARDTATGWKFYDGDSRCEAATKSWGRWVRPFHNVAKSARGGARSTQADPVAKLLAAYEKLSAGDKRRFRAAI